MIVGGNIEGFTRVMTTAIALETSKGDLPLALALGVLLAVVLALNAVIALDALARRPCRRRGAGGSGRMIPGCSCKGVDLRYGTVRALRAWTCASRWVSGSR